MTDTRPVAVCGHRGTPAHRPENTIASFEYARSLGATWIEFDVRPARGGALVVHHDPIDRHGRRLIDTPPSELDPSIPTLQQVVDSCPDLGLDIELKTDDCDHTPEQYATLVAEPLAAIADQHPAPTIVTSFDAETLAILKGCNDDLTTGLLFHDRTGQWALEEADRAGHDAIAPWHPLVSRSLVEDAHIAGLQVMTWTVNSSAAATRVIRAGVDMVIGDDPSLLLAVLDRG